MICSASTESDTYATQPGAVPTTVSAMGIWTPDDAAFYLRNGFRGLEWPSIADPNFSNVKVLIHLDRKGQNGNLRMLPVSASPNDCDAYEVVDQGVAGMAQLAHRRAGLYSFLCVGASYVLHNINNSLSLSTGHITAEGFVYPTAAGADQAIWDFRTSGADATRPYIRLSGGKLALTINAVDKIIDSSTISINAWHHFAWCRDTVAGNSYLYLDGVSLGSFADTTNYSTTSSVHMGSHVTVAGPFSGTIDEFRLTLGSARYPGGTTFTVPSVPFPDY